MPHGSTRKTRSARLLRWLRRTVTLKELRKRRAERDRVKHEMGEIAKFPKNANAPRHGLPGELIVSLTSYPARFKTLHLTIKALLDQKVKPDRVILWIDRHDMRKVPKAVRELEGPAFSILTGQDVRSFNKIVPALIAFPNSFIVVADDDLYYPDNWLQGLVEAYDPGQPTIVYHRGHRLAHSADGSLAPYRAWQHEVTDPESLIPGTGIMPTGVGGVLYPPGSLPPKAVDIGLIRQLSETCDDSWLYFMWRQTAWTAKRVPGEGFRIVDWPQSQQHSLRKFHRGGMKDEHLRALSDYFGTP